jgi:hypothetical protein
MLIILLEQGTNDTITFSSVTSFTETYPSGVTSSPVESGSTISDNITIGNNTFSLSGVISDWDYYNPAKEIAFGSNAVYNYTYESRFNLAKFEPTGFTTTLDTIPSDERAEQIKFKLQRMRNNPSLITLLIYNDDNKLSTYYDNCAITSLSFSESTDTSFCVYPVMSLEQLQIAYVEVETIEKGKIPDLPNRSRGSGETNVGKAGDCLSPTITTVDGTTETSVVDDTKIKVAKGQKPPEKCNPTAEDKNALAKESHDKMIKRQRDERVYANSATADAARALDGAIENKQGRPVLEKLKNQYLTALKYSDTTLPIQQAKELAAAKAAQGQ